MSPILNLGYDSLGQSFMYYNWEESESYTSLVCSSLTWFCYFSLADKVLYKCSDSIDSYLAESLHSSTFNRSITHLSFLLSNSGKSSSTPTKEATLTKPNFSNQFWASGYICQHLSDWPKLDRYNSKPLLPYSLKVVARSVLMCRLFVWNATTFEYNYTYWWSSVLLPRS